MSFAAFFMHADGTILGRYGSRSTRPDEAEKLISLKGLSEALSGALTLHKGYPANRAILTGKQSVPVKYKVPEDYPHLSKFKPELDFGGAVAKSCVHCHQIRDAERRDFRETLKPIPDKVLFPYPLPDVVGISTDKNTRGTVSNVSAGSAAATSGIQAGDEIVAVSGQPILSLADIQWVLQNAPDSGSLEFTIRRSGAITKKNVPLAAGWRRTSDISWRTSTWSLRRMAFGGMVLEANPGSTSMSLTAKHVGQYGDHAIAKRAGLVKGDRITSFNGITEPLTETLLLQRILSETKPGDRVKVTATRNGRPREFTLRLP